MFLEYIGTKDFHLVLPPELVYKMCNNRKLFLKFFLAEGYVILFLMTHSHICFKEPCHKTLMKKHEK